MKRKIFSVLIALVLVLSFSLVTAVPVGAVGPIRDVDVTVISSGDHGGPSDPYAAATAIETFELGEGTWKITASGAMNFAGASAPNVGLRAGNGEGVIMLAKSNVASEADTNIIGISRGGFSVVGAVEGPITVDLVAYGGSVFEYNLVAIGATPSGVEVVSSPDHGGPSVGYAAATAIESFELGAGIWEITASGAMDFAVGHNPNVGLRAGDGEGVIMLAKSNVASSADTRIISRGGFSVVGAVEGPITVDLVAYGDVTVFEHNLVAIGGPGPVVNEDSGKSYGSIQDAINAADPGDTINVAGGTYAEPQLSINKSLTILGAGEDDVTIQRSSGSSYFLSVSGDINFTMKDLTIDASGSATTNFVAHISDLNIATFENVTVIGQGKDYTTDGGDYYYTSPGDTNVVGGLDLIDVANASLTNVTVRDVSRNGFSFTNVGGYIRMYGFTASNCGHTASTGWAGLALYRDDGGKSKLILQRDWVNSISNAPIGVNAHSILGEVELHVYGPDDKLNISDVLVPVVAPNTSISDEFALRAIPSAPYKVYATNGPSSGFASYFFTTDDAIAAALEAFILFEFEHVVNDLATPKFIVGAGMNIQSAIDAASDGDTIKVLAGTYQLVFKDFSNPAEIKIMDKSLTLLGAQADVPIVDGERAGDESIIRGEVDWLDRPTTCCVVRIQNSDVVVNGFTIENAKNWIIGITGSSIRHEGISDILISYNYIEESGRDGIFRDSAAADVTIDHNYIASNPRGIATNGGATTITNNTFYGNGKGIDFQGGDPYDAYFSDYADPKYPTIISGNTFTDDSTSIYLYELCYCHQSITITGNDITGARSAAIFTHARHDVDIVNPAIHFNNIWNNEFGINNTVEEIILDAKYNWWGGIGGPGGVGSGKGDSVSANVDYDPWLTENQAKTVSDGIAYFGSNISLEPGWNTLSVPLKLKDSANTMAEIVDLGDFLTSENVQIVYQYNPESPAVWKNIGVSATELDPGRGYYIKILGTDTVDFPVLYSGTWGLPTLELSAGWNLIGSGFGIDKTDYGIAATEDVKDGQKDVATALYSIKDKCSVVVSPSTQGQVAAWGTTVIDDTKFMIVGEAYWVFMTAPATLAGFEVTPIYYLP